MKQVIDTQKLENWLDANKNVIMIGKPGVGKTSVIKKLFESRKLSYRYFSASTMDPYVDFVGVPRVVTDKDGSEFLKLVRQKGLDDVEALMFDEFNRAPKKIRNAVMELIQFRSINGIPFPKLKVVWAAINPQDEDETLDVEPLDPAQIDRFNIKYNIDYRPCPVYFTDVFGEELGMRSVSWWNKLPEDQKDMLSPRRFADAIEWHLKNNGDIRDMIDDQINTSALIELLNSKPMELQIRELFEGENVAKIGSWVNQENNLTAALDIIKSKPEYMTCFLPHIHNERLGSLIMEDQYIEMFAIRNAGKFQSFSDVCKSLIESRSNAQVADRIEAEALKNMNSIAGSSVMKYLNSKIVANPGAKFYSKVPPNTQHTFEKHITCVEVKSNGWNCRSADDKVQCWRFFVNYVSPELSPNTPYNELDMTMKFLNNICMTPNKAALDTDSLPELAGVINTVVKSALKSGMTLVQVWNAMPNVKEVCSLPSLAKDVYYKTGV